MKENETYTSQYLAFCAVPFFERDGDARWWDMDINPFLEGTDKHTRFEEQECEKCRANIIDPRSPSHDGSSLCRMRTSIASGGNRSHCTCRACF
jgi:hypothetical protein